MSDGAIVAIGRDVIIIVAIVCITLFAMHIVTAFRVIRAKQIDENIVRQLSERNGNGSYHVGEVRADFEDGKTRVIYEQPQNEAERSKEQEKICEDTLLSFFNNIIQIVPKLKK